MAFIFLNLGHLILDFTDPSFSANEIFLHVIKIYGVDIPYFHINVSVDIYLDWFSCSTIVYWAVKHGCVTISVVGYEFLWVCTKECFSLVIWYHLLRNPYTNLHKDCTVLHLYHQWINIPLSHIITGICIQTS